MMKNTSMCKTFLRRRKEFILKNQGFQAKESRDKMKDKNSRRWILNRKRKDQK